MGEEYDEGVNGREFDVDLDAAVAVIAVVVDWGCGDKDVVFDAVASAVAAAATPGNESTDE